MKILTDENKEQPKPELNMKVMLTEKGNVNMGMNPEAYNAMILECKNLIGMIADSNKISNIKLKTNQKKREFTTKYFPLLSSLAKNLDYNAMLKEVEKRKSNIVIPSPDIIIPK